MSILHLNADYYKENETRYVFIDGNACNSMDDCYTTLRRQLSLPDYFGHNLDALEEVLEDLDWIAEQKVKIIFSNVDALLKKDHKRETFLDIFSSLENEKVEVIFLGQA